MLIRTFDFERDCDSVLDLWRGAGPGVRLGASDTPEAIRLKLQRDPDLFLVLEVDGALAGAVLGGFDGRRGMVYHLAVAPAHRRHGLGRALLAEIEARLKARGCRKVYLMVTPDNPEAILFYQQLGWQVMPVTFMGRELA